ncbi:MAG: S9 family peptidase [Planctomycetota bacterium]|nr:MAG: S9 family peptidase [Planctomycetota bacterium]
MSLVEDYHGTKVADPYRWLEDLDSPRTRRWVEAQNAVSSRFLNSLPDRDYFLNRLERLWNYERRGTPERKGDRYFFSRNDGLQNQSVLFVQDGKHGNPRVLLDPNGLSEDGTAAISGTAVSENGQYLAYGISRAGSDWQEWFVRDVATGKDLGDHLRWVKFSGASWTHDHQGFFYSRYPEPPEGDAYEAVNENHKVYFHRLGTSQDQDVLVYERPEQPKWGFRAEVSVDGRWLLIAGSEGTERKARYWFKDLQNNEPIRPLFTEFDADYHYIGNRDQDWFFFTDKDAPKGKIIQVDPRRPHSDHWREVIPEGEDTMDDAAFFHQRLVVQFMHNAHSRLEVFDLDGRSLFGVDLPTLGSVGSLSGKADDAEAYFSFSSFTYPTTLFQLDMSSGAKEVFWRPELDFDPSAFAVEQVWYPSKDGTQVPMFLIHRKDLVRNGQNPTLLYGYGGFNIPLTPSFRVNNLVWLEQGGIYAVANLRGGGEFGKDWYLAGTVHQKQNVFDDFIAAAEYLIEEGYTSTPKLAIRGGSNGGLLVGACMTQRPELFGAALPAVGVLDMLRYHKFTIGWAWVSDYGSSDDPEQFRTLLGYSPLHNLRPGVHYPPTLVTTADHDDRVVPGHSYKFTAALQKVQGSASPVLIRIETNAGHGRGKPISKILEENADIWAFLAEVLDMKVST